MNDSSPPRVACVLGTRPEAVKMAPVIRALQAEAHLAPVVISTGQHRELLTHTMALFGYAPDVALDLMQPAQRLASFFGRCVEALDIAIQETAPRAIVAQGDTSTVLAASLVAFYNDIPFFHVEAGLRTSDFRSPFPEEMNRRLASRFAALHFAPTALARENLRREGIADDRIVVTGNTVIDALLHVRALHLPHGLALSPGKRLVVVTAHRREHHGEGIRAILRALEAIAADYPDVEIVYAAHPSPAVRADIAAVIPPDGPVRIIEPPEYGPFVSLLDQAFLILTDSGGIQEEAPALGKPVLVLRNDTERPEAVAAGVARLVGTDTGTIVRETARLLDDADHYRTMTKGGSPYGDGHAAQRIVDAMGRYLASRAR